MKAIFEVWTVPCILMTFVASIAAGKFDLLGRNEYFDTSIAVAMFIASLASLAVVWDSGRATLRKYERRKI